MDNMVPRMVIKFRLLLRYFMYSHNGFNETTKMHVHVRKNKVTSFQDFYNESKQIHPLE